MKCRCFWIPTPSHYLYGHSKKKLTIIVYRRPIVSTSRAVRQQEKQVSRKQCTHPAFESSTFTLFQQLLLTPLKFQIWSISWGWTLPALSICIHRRARRFTRGVRDISILYLYFCTRCMFMQNLASSKESVEYTSNYRFHNDLCPWIHLGNTLPQYPRPFQELWIKELCSIAVSLKYIKNFDLVWYSPTTWTWNAWNWKWDLPAFSTLPWMTTIDRYVNTVNSSTATSNCVTSDVNLQM